MKVKANPPKEDPATAAKRAVEEARAEADATAATQGLLTRRTRRVMRIFGKPVAGGFRAGAGAGAGAGGTSASSGVLATPRTGVVSGGSRGGGFGRALANIAQY